MDILDKIEKFYGDFDGEKGVIGKSCFDRPIYYFAVKKTERPKIIVQYAIHAREYITSYLCLKQIEEFIKNGKFGTVYFLPVLNPDGVKIALTERPLYKANGRGVDLNVNFDARWGLGEKNVKIAGDENYIGEYPFSEPESTALKNFTLKVMPDMTVSYHCKGEEIYYEFFQNARDKRRDYGLACVVKEITGYAIKSTLNSCGGYKDWCIKALKIPAITVEVGSDNLSHPLKEDCLNDIFNKNRRVLEILTKTLSEKLCKKNLCVRQLKKR